MEHNPTSSRDSHGEVPSAPASRGGLAKPVWARRGIAIWAIVIAFMLSMMWPMLKGNYYKAIGATPPADGIPWRTDYAAALAESKEANKPALLVFTASWCPPCKVMKHEVWPEPDVRDAIVKGYIPVLLDVDLPGSAPAAKQYQVSSIPSVFIVDEKGQILRSGSFMNKSGMLTFLRSTSNS